MELELVRETEPITSHYLSEVESLRTICQSLQRDKQNLAKQVIELQKKIRRIELEAKRKFK